MTLGAETAMAALTVKIPSASSTQGEMQKTAILKDACTVLTILERKDFF